MKNKTEELFESLKSINYPKEVKKNYHEFL
jgi:hypothetical protein